MVADAAPGALDPHDGNDPFRKIPVPSGPEALVWRLTEPYVCVLRLKGEAWSELGMGFPRGMARVEHTWSGSQFALSRKYRHPEYRLFTGMLGEEHRHRGAVEHHVGLWAPSTGRHRLGVELVPASAFRGPVEVDLAALRKDEGMGGLQVGTDLPAGWEHCGDLRMRPTGSGRDVGVPLGQVLRLPAGEYELMAGSGYRTFFKDAGLDRKRVEVKAGKTTVVPWVPPFPLLPCRLRVQPPPGLPAAGFAASIVMLDPAMDPEPLYEAHTLDLPEVLWLPPGKVRVLGRAEPYETVIEEAKVRAGVEGIQDLVVPVRFPDR